MLRELDTLADVNMYFEQLERTPNWKITRAQIYGMAYRNQEQQEKEKKIEDTISEKFFHILNTTIISEDMAVVEVKTKNEENLYFPIVNGKNLKHASFTYDEALVVALSTKYGYGQNAPSMIHNMLRMDTKMKEC